MLSFNQLDKKNRKFWQEKGDKLSYRDDYLLQIGVSDDELLEYKNNVNNDKNYNKCAKLIEKSIKRLEVEYMLALINDKGGRVTLYQNGYITNASGKKPSVSITLEKIGDFINDK